MLCICMELSNYLKHETGSTGQSKRGQVNQKLSLQGSERFPKVYIIHDMVWDGTRNREHE